MRSGNKDELMSNLIPWITTHGITMVGRLAKIYIHYLYTETGCRLDDLSGMRTNKAEGGNKINVYFYLIYFILMIVVWLVGWFWGMLTFLLVNSLRNSVQQWGFLVK